MVAELSRPKLRAAGLTLPLIVFIAVAFTAPISMIFVRSVYDPKVVEILPNTLAMLADWDGRELPEDAVYQTAAQELQQALETRTIGPLALRVGRLRGGMHGALVDTARHLEGMRSDSWRQAMIEAHSAWAEAETWRVLREAGKRFTLRHLLEALDFEQDTNGNWSLKKPEQRIYAPLLAQTLLTGAVIALICLVLGYPVAFFMANSPSRWANLVLMVILLQFWISMLVRTAAWLAMLQNHGVVNNLLVALWLVPDDGRLPLIYNMSGTIIATSHAMLPFLVLPLYSIMRTIPPSYGKAAASLGANPWQAFLHVYWPQTLPGVAAGTLLVFMLSIGYYVTPALIGGQHGQFFSNVVDYHMQKTLNWGLAGALNVVLFVCVLVVYVTYSRFVGWRRLRLG